MSESNWTLDSLNKAYQQGYMMGLAGKESSQCPYQTDVLIAAWEAGWDDGYSHHAKSISDRTHSRHA